MKEKGYVVCLLKYILGDDNSNIAYWDAASENKKPIAFGYFGRVDVVGVSRFKDYMKVASTYNAEFTGTRKQLLIYPLLNTQPDQICWHQFDENDGSRLPFQPVIGNRRPCFCCLSILNISQSVKEKVCGTDYTNGIRKIAQCLSDQLEQFISGNGKDAWMPFAIMGLLGTEDLCLISLSNDFNVICRAIDHLRGLTAGEDGDFIIENTHSIQMVDFSERASVPQWGETTAEIHFSLKTNGGMAYLKKVRDLIADYSPDQDVCLESQIGEYDAVIRCPATALGEHLYGYGQALNYNNSEYRKAAYQSETLLYQQADVLSVCRTPVALYGKNVSPSHKSDIPNSGERIANETGEWMKQPVIEINRCISDAQGASSNMYITQVLYRLLKDFKHIASIPFGGSFQEDLSIQFRAAINAVVCSAQQYQQLSKNYGSDARRRFDSTFPQIIDALSSSMQTASQIDRLYFEEQQSHLQNTGAYHKVLLAYYGIVKILLQFVYGISRKCDSGQPVLIPLLSFGHAQIICSKAFDTTYDDRPARLLCITLPYQALSNIPKYIGPLAHEIFHYSTPADRAQKNEAAGKCLTAVAFKYFLDQVGIASKCPGQSGAIIFNQYRTEFLDTVGDLFGNIARNLAEQYPAELLNVSPEESNGSAIISEAFFQCMQMALSPPLRQASGNPVELLYCEGWLELRKRLKKTAESNPRAVMLFALDKDWDDDKAREHIRQIYQRCLSNTASEIPAYLGVYEMALREVPPDLFDIGLVMWGMTNEEQTKQYLWQIHSIRSDKLYYSGSTDSECLEMSVEGNNIRFGIVLDYLIFGLINDSAIAEIDTRKEQIAHKLQQWYGSNNLSESQKDEWEKNCTAISNDYSKYFEDSLFVNILFKDYIERVIEQIKDLSNRKNIHSELERLSGFYGEYCAAKDSALGDECEAILMDLSLRVIESYQCQPKLSELSKLCGSAPALVGSTRPIAYVGGIYDAQKCEAMVFGPEELSAKIVEVYAAMHLKNPTAPLWFRGQRLEGWPLLPNITRKAKEGSFLPGMRKMMTLAKAKILPQGEGFHDAEWLALLQHYDFNTNLLDWSENLHSALFFAIQKWMENPETAKKGNAAIFVLNPILYNVAKDVIEKHDKVADLTQAEDCQRALCRLKTYLETGDDNGMQYAIPLFTSSEDRKDCRCYFDLNYGCDVDLKKESVRLPIAAMTPANSDRMKQQSGVFTFLDVRTQPNLKDGKYTFETYDLVNIQKRYFRIAVSTGIKNPTPFLFKLVLSSANAEAFVHYVQAIGMRKYRMYPELNNLAKDIMSTSL